MTLVRPFILSERPAGTSAYPNGHYLVPDTNIFLYCMDVIEHESAFYDVIVLQTVLDELRNRSLPLYNRLRALTKSEGKRFYCFHNDFHQETYVKRLEGETINDRNDRAVRQACKWYAAHLTEAVSGTKSKLPEIVMLSDDRDNLKKAQQDGIACCSSKLTPYCSSENMHSASHFCLLFDYPHTKLLSYLAFASPQDYCSLSFLFIYLSFCAFSSAFRLQ